MSATQLSRLGEPGAGTSHPAPPAADPRRRSWWSPARKLTKASPHTILNREGVRRRGREARFARQLRVGVCAFGRQLARPDEPPRRGTAAGPISMDVRGPRILCRRHGGRGCTLLCCLVGGEADAHAHVVIPRRVLRKPPPSRTAGLGLADGRARCARSRSCPRNVLRRLFSAAFGFASPNKKAAAGRPPPHSGPPGAGRSPPASRPPSGRDGRDPENKE